MAKQKITLETLDARFTKLEGLIERGFGAIANDMATKDQLIALHTQVNSIERQLRGMKHIKLEDRVAAIAGDHGLSCRAPKDSRTDTT